MSLLQENYVTLAKTWHISLVPLRYGINWQGSRFTAYVAIFRNDGTISISHGGTEMGQEIDTKVHNANLNRFSNLNPNANSDPG